MALDVERSIAPAVEPSAPVAALIALLEQLADVILATPTEIYTARLQPAVSGSIGAHVRHALDHVAALVSTDGTALSYDRRDRGTVAETDPSAALGQILRLEAALGRWLDRSLDDPMLVRSRVSVDGSEVVAWSSVGRELAFVVSHTIHHQALIAVLLAVHGESVPARFGVAPSTPQAS